MTVREWFRVMRAARWAQDGPDYWTFAQRIHLLHNPTEGLDWIHVTSGLYIIIGAEALATWERRQQAFEAVQADVEAAMRRILHASQVTE